MVGPDSSVESSISFMPGARSSLRRRSQRIFAHSEQESLRKGGNMRGCGTKLDVGCPILLSLRGEAAAEFLRAWRNGILPAGGDWRSLCVTQSADYLCNGRRRHSDESAGIANCFSGKNSIENIRHE